MNVLDRRGVRPIVLVGIGIALFGFPLGNFLLELLWDGSVSAAWLSVYKWLLVGLLLGIVLFVERESLSSIGLSPPDRWDVLTGVGLFVVGLLSLGVMSQLIGLLGFESGITGDGGGEPVGTRALAVGLFVGVTAGITEEVLFRGYALERIETVTNSTWIAGTVTAILFVVLHVETHGIGGLLIISPLAVLLTVAYVWRRNLFVPIIGHVLINGLWNAIELASRLLGAL